MQRLEVSGAVRPLYESLGFTELHLEPRLIIRGPVTLLLLDTFWREQGRHLFY